MELHATARRRVCVLTILATVNACGTHRLEFRGPPPIPARSGPLSLDVVYPRAGGVISARDSNFIFGSVGNGAARLTINGRSVPVEANGAFLAWLPVPEPEGDTLVRYQLAARLGDREARLDWLVRVAASSATVPGGPVSVDTSSLGPRGAWWVAPGEYVPVQVRASPGAEVQLFLPNGDTLELKEEAGLGGASWATRLPGRVPPSQDARRPVLFVGEFPAVSLGRGRLAPDLPPVPAGPSGLGPLCQSSAAPVTPGPEETAASDSMKSPPEVDTAMAAASLFASTPAVEPAGSSDSLCAALMVKVGVDTTRLTLPLDLWVTKGPDPSVELREQPSAAGRDGFVVGRAAPAATTLWLWAEGARVPVTGRRGDQLRIALDAVTEAWVAADEAVWLPGLATLRRARVATVRLRSMPTHTETWVSVDRPVPYAVHITDRRVTLAIYGAYGDTDWLRYGPEDPLIRAVRWEQVSSDRYLLHLDLAEPVWGYRVRYEPGALVLTLRRPPPIDADRPLEDRTVMIDPGHPPAGAIGPTRLYEGDANLAVAYRLKRLLEREGARPLLTRADRRSVRLYDRTRRAEMADADVLVSIHNNALPDGVNPFESHGTSVFYFHPHSLDLARALQRSLVESLGLRDLGIGRASLAVVRTTWLPAVLTEGAFMMIPAQEAALRVPDYQEAYARGLLEGLRRFFRERAR